MKKPITPALHGALDYVFSGIQLVTPALLGVNSTARKTFQAVGASILALDALTDTPAGLKRSISFNTHHKADASFLAGLTLLSFASFVRKDKKALAFHLSFLGLALVHYMLTDYKSGK